MKQQTAVDFLLSELDIAKLIEKEKLTMAAEVIRQAKAMEKEQISKAWDDGNYAYFYSKETGIDFDNGKQYYNETY